MKQRKYMLLAMLATAALIMTACSNKKADVDTAEAQESPDAYVTEEETGEGDGIYCTDGSGRSDLYSEKCV